MRRSDARAVLAATAGRIPATLTFLAVTGGAWAWVESLASEAREEQILAASTNLHNLLQGDVFTFVTSAFVRDDVDVVSFVTLGIVLAAAELRWGYRRVLSAFAGGHVGATVLVAAGLFVGSWLGWVPPGWETAPDVGVSYGVVCLAGALTAELPRVPRRVWAAGWLAFLGARLVDGGTFTDAGHLCALLIGFTLAAVWLRRRAAPVDSVPASCEAAPHGHEGT